VTGDVARAAMEAARNAAKVQRRPTFRRLARPRRTWSGPGASAQDPQLLGGLAASLIGELGGPEERERPHEDVRPDREEGSGGA
jgi:hypothetical protein